jgi:suppressor of fused protein SUFU
VAAPTVLREVFTAYRTQLGEEDDGFVFEDDRAPITRVDVFVYRPRSAAGTTTFATIGMAAREMPAAPGPGGGGRAELHLVRRGRLARTDEGAIAARLADLAIHPFVAGEQLNWGHMIGFDQDFPTFPGCRAVFLAGPLTDHGMDYVRTSSGDVRIVNVVPITDTERRRGRTLPPLAFASSLLEQGDIFDERRPG